MAGERHGRGMWTACYVFPGSKERPGRDAEPSHLLVPWSWKGRAIPLLPLRVVRPVQSLSACTRVHFTFTFCMVRNTHYIAPRYAFFSVSIYFLPLSPKYLTKHPVLEMYLFIEFNLEPWLTKASVPSLKKESINSDVSVIIMVTLMG